MYLVFITVLLVSTGWMSATTSLAQSLNLNGLVAYYPFETTARMEYPRQSVSMPFNLLFRSDLESGYQHTRFSEFGASVISKDQPLNQRSNYTILFGIRTVAKPGIVYSEGPGEAHLNIQVNADDRIWIGTSNRSTPLKQIKASQPITDGLWHQVVITAASTYNSNELSAKIFVDGIPRGEGFLNMLAYSPKSADVITQSFGRYLLSGGSISNIVLPFKGDLAHFFVYNRVLSRDEIQAAYNYESFQYTRTAETPILPDPNNRPQGGALEPFLLSYWPLDGNGCDKGGSAVLEPVDQSSSPTNLVQYGPGILGKAWSGSGQTNALSLGTSQNWRVTNDFTVCFWVYWEGPTPPPHDPNHQFFYVSKTMGEGHLLGVGNGSLTNGISPLVVQFDPASRLSIREGLIPRQWTHLSLRMKEGYASVFRNAIKLAEWKTGAMNPMVAENTASWNIPYPGLWTVNGKIDEFYVFCKPLVEDELKRVMQGWEPRPRPPALSWIQWPTEDGGNGTWYGLTRQAYLKWEDAEAEAAAYGTHLASIHSLAEQRWISRIFLENRQVWLGGTTRNPQQTWQWIDGSPWDFTFWGKREPDDGASRPEDVLMANWQYGLGEFLGAWNVFGNGQTPLHGLMKRVSPMPVILSAKLTHDRKLQLSIQGMAGKPVAIERSSDLKEWEWIAEVTPTDAVTIISPARIMDSEKRFFRLVQTQ